MKEFPLLSMFNIHENLLESLLELQNYADVQAVLAKYDGEETSCIEVNVQSPAARCGSILETLSEL